ncbi:MAG TPA: HAMP domain-containing protein [Oscillatoriaceae cyanobacterium M33_DOE_052]|uniref:HAMP domain-containing protein n=1 Tax=Planktothricoides sp. SpSt-374 TaxID=2282167 RepID=A0A7C3VF70_9CYAN|nr:HAMP domain-containing protein [Oscillatoriaceae cyanobacterium M33_DOE_052]
MWIATLNSLITRASRKVPLRAIIVLPFFVQILGAVGLTGWLSFRNGQQAVNELATQLSGEVADRIEQHLWTYLHSFERIQEVQQAEIKTGILNLDDFDRLRRYFWYLVQTAQPGTAYLFGNENGQFIGVRREKDGLKTLLLRDNTTGNKLQLYRLNANGEPANLNQTIDFDPRSRPWYQQAWRDRAAIWSPIYPSASQGTLLITAALPVFQDNTKQLRGVLAIDITLDQISDFLRQLKISHSGQAFIMERNGEMVASSAPDSPLFATATEQKQLLATDSSDALIKTTAKALGQKMAGFENIKTRQQLTVVDDLGKRLLVQVMPLRDDARGTPRGDRHLDLLIVVVIPESDFMARIDANTRSTILLCAASLLAATLLGFVTSRLIVEPIMRLNSAARHLSRGEWERHLPETSSSELAELAKSFNAMAQQLKASFMQLAAINAAYGHFVPHEFLEFLDRKSIVELRIGDHVLKEMTVMFADIRSFTTLSEAMTAQETFNFLNSYLSRIGPIVRNHHGFIDKYIGDGVMALFPREPGDAVQAAIALQAEVLAYNELRATEGKNAISVGIGLHVGSLILGTIGEEKRMESTVIADAVNLASRLEGLTKLYGARILTSEETLSQIATVVGCDCYRFLGRVFVKGKNISVSVFEIFAADPEPQRSLKWETVSDFGQAIDLYHQRQFAAAAAIFAQIVQINPQDQAAALYRQRCQDYQAFPPPADWNGIEHLEKM